MIMLLGFFKAIPAKVWEYLAVILIVAASYAFAYHEGGNAPRAALATFTAQVKAAGEAQERATALQIKADKLRQEKADADHTKAVAGLTGTIARLRDANSRGSGLSAPAPITPGADRTCFDPAKLDAALRGLGEGFLGIVETGAKAVVDLDNAKDWAQEKK